MRYIVVPTESIYGNRKNLCYFYDSLEDLGHELRMDEDWEVYRIDLKERVRVHALFIEEKFDAIQIGEINNA